MKITDYKKICPYCNMVVYYSNKRLLTVSIKNNKLCKSCSRRGNLNPLFGKPMSLQQKDKISKGKIGVKQSENARLKKSISQKIRYLDVNERRKTSELVKQAMHRPDVREKHIEKLHHSKWIKVRTDKGQLELLDKWKKLGFNFEPNYQIKTDVDLFYVDGYDKEKNVVIEYDTKYHNFPQQHKKDLIRQNKIIDILNPKKFWRYNSVNKTFSNILGGN